MPTIQPIPAITFAAGNGGDISAKIAPPYDVLDQAAKSQLLAKDPANIVAIDLPHLPPKTAGPDAVYQQAAETYRAWLAKGILVRRRKPAIFIYQQTYAHRGRNFQRRGLIANLAIQPFGPSPDLGAPGGGIYPHEQTFSGPKEDRMKLMRATKAQLSPIFGLHSDPSGQMVNLLDTIISASSADLHGATSGDQVLHEVWAVDNPAEFQSFAQVFTKANIFIADGHHRYTTAMNYRQALQSQSPLPVAHPANFCLFVLVAMEDPGMIVLPTHRVLGGMSGFSMEKFEIAAKDKLKIVTFAGKDLAALEAALPSAGPHAIGLFNPADSRSPLSIATTVDPDPLRASHPSQSAPWRQLDVAIVQHLIVESICQPAFCSGGQTITWKFPHTLAELQVDASGPGYQLGLVLQPTPLQSVQLVSQAGELMPQKSTFFYPKLATGLVINPLE